MNDPYSPDYRLACSALPGSHSDNRTNIHYGAPVSVLMCGRHATYLSGETWRIMRDAGTVPNDPTPILD